MKEKRIPRNPNANRAKRYIRNSGRGEGEQFRPEVQNANCQTLIVRLGASSDDDRDLYDEGEGLHSARKRTNLDEFDKMIEDAIRDKDCKYIVSADSSRVFRNTQVGLNVLHRIEYHGLEWHTATQGQLSYENDRLRLMTVVTMAMDEQYARDVSTWIRERHYAPARKAGLYFSHAAPFGLTRSGSIKKSTLAWSPNDDFPIVREILERYVRTWNGVEVFRQMRGRTWSNGARMDASVIRKIIQKVDRYKPFLPETLYNQVIVIRAKKAQRKMNGAEQHHPTLLLRGLVSCDLCGESLVSHTQVRKAIVTNRYYKHRYKGCIQRCYIAADVDAEFWEQFAGLERLPESDRAALRDDLLHPKNHITTIDHSARIEQIEKELRGYSRMRAMDELTQQQYLDFKLPIEQELASLQSIKPTAPAFAFTEDDVDLLFNFGTIAMQELAAVEPERMNLRLHEIVKMCHVSPDNVRVEWYPPFDRIIRV